MSMDGHPQRPPDPDAAEHVIAATGRMAAQLANELRAPLFGIAAAAQVLRFRARDDPMVERNIGRILHEVERLNGLVAELHEYGSPHPPRRAPTDPDAIWDEVLEGNRGLLERRSLTLRRERPDHPVKLSADASRLAQLFLTLLRNAAGAAPVGSAVTLRSTLGPARAWCCTLHDTGPAIPADALPGAFEPFAPTRGGGGGVGLALCRRIVQEHRGTITLDSAPERGTAVTITLPARGRNDVT